MREHRTRALVVNVYDYGESDRLVHLYTEDLGRVSAIAKGARRSRRRFPGTLEILTVLDVRIVEPPRASLLRLEGARLVQPFERFVSDLGRFGVACMLAEVLDRFTGDHEANPELFRFALGVLDVLVEEPADRLLALLTLTKTLARLGFRPRLSDCVACGSALGAGEVRVAFVPREGGVLCRACADAEAPRVPVRIVRALEQGIRQPLRERHLHGLQASELREAERMMDRFFRFHIGIELRSEPVVRGLLRSTLDGQGRYGDTAAAPPEGETQVFPDS